MLYEREEKKITLDQLQQRDMEDGGDHHAIVVDPVNKKLYEFFKIGKGGRQVESRWGLDL